LTVESLEGRTLLSTWIVNSLGDSGTGTGFSGDLRFVITQINQAGGDNVVNFSVTGTITLNSALPDLNNTTGLTDIEGPGPSSLTVARSSAAGTPNFGIFAANSFTHVKLAGLTIEGGNSTGCGGVSNDGTMTLANCTVSNNVGNDGGGIRSRGGTLMVADCTIANNTATVTAFGGGNGAGIENFQGTLTVINSTITQNKCISPSSGLFPGDGGGIWTGGAVVAVTDSTISKNSADAGGGMFIVYRG
jgi:hypothetical protein